MFSMTTEIINKAGLHARPASDLTLKAKEFSSNITILNLDAEVPKPINVKSVVKIMAGRFNKGSRVKIVAEGEDEKQAVEALVALLNNGFDE